MFSPYSVATVMEWLKVHWSAHACAACARLTLHTSGGTLRQAAAGGALLNELHWALLYWASVIACSCSLSGQL